MFRSKFEGQFPIVYRLALLCAALLVFAGSQREAQGQTAASPIQTFAFCYTYNPATTRVQFVLGYIGAPHTYIHLSSGTLANYFEPGEFDLGQPEDFFSGTVHDMFAVSYDASDSPSITWVLNGTKLLLSVNGTTPPCRPGYFAPGASLSYTAAGTYPSQYLGSMAVASVTPNVTVLPVSNAAGFTVTNIQSTAAASVDTNLGPLTTYSFYGDVTVAPGPASSTALLVQAVANGVQLGLGQTAVSFSGTPTDTTGCAATVTSQVTGNMGPARQVFDTGIWTQLVTFKNTSANAIVGPIQLALTNLSSNAKLFTASGTGTCPAIAGAPYINVANGLKAGGQAAVVLTFTDSGVPSTAITYTPVVVSGGSKL